MMDVWFKDVAATLVHTRDAWGQLNEVRFLVWSAGLAALSQPSFLKDTLAIAHRPWTMDWKPSPGMDRPDQQPAYPMNAQVAAQSVGRSILTSANANLNDTKAASRSRLHKQSGSETRQV